jgi:hypothetical protein
MNLRALAAIRTPVEGNVLRSAVQCDGGRDDTGQTLAREAEVKECDGCANVASTHYCSTCDDFLCAGCVERHTRSRKKQRHLLNTAAEQMATAVAGDVGGGDCSNEGVPLTQGEARGDAALGIPKTSAAPGAAELSRAHQAALVWLDEMRCYGPAIVSAVSAVDGAEAEVVQQIDSYFRAVWQKAVARREQLKRQAADEANLKRTALTVEAGAVAVAVEQLEAATNYVRWVGEHATTAEATAVRPHLVDGLVRLAGWAGRVGCGSAPCTPTVPTNIRFVATRADDDAVAAISAAGAVSGLCATTIAGDADARYAAGDLVGAAQACRRGLAADPASPAVARLAHRLGVALAVLHHTAASAATGGGGCRPPKPVSDGSTPDAASAEEVEAAFARALAADPDHVPAYCSLAGWLGSDVVGHVARAEAAYRHVLARAPNHRVALLGLADIMITEHGQVVGAGIFTLGRGE